MHCGKCRNPVLRREFTALSCLLCGWIVYGENLGAHAWRLQDQAFRCMKTYFTLMEQRPTFLLKMATAPPG